MQIHRMLSNCNIHWAKQTTYGTFFSLCRTAATNLGAQAVTYCCTLNKLTAVTLSLDRPYDCTAGLQPLMLFLVQTMLVIQGKRTSYRVTDSRLQ